MDIKTIDKKVWVRLISLFIILTNQVLVTFFNLNIFQTEDEMIYESVSTILTFVFSIYTAWKDTPITLAAQKGHQLTDKLKKENKNNV